MQSSLFNVFLCFVCSAGLSKLFREWCAVYTELTGHPIPWDTVAQRVGKYEAKSKRNAFYIQLSWTRQYIMRHLIVCFLRSFLQGLKSCLYTIGRWGSKKLSMDEVCYVNFEIGRIARAAPILISYYLMLHLNFYFRNFAGFQLHSGRQTVSSVCWWWIAQGWSWRRAHASTCCFSVHHQTASCGTPLIFMWCSI